MKKAIFFLLFGALLTVVCSPFVSSAKTSHPTEVTVKAVSEMNDAVIVEVASVQPTFQLLRVVEYAEPVNKGIKAGFIKPVIRPPNYGINICNPY